MASFDFEAAHRRIAEYESRTDSAEQRAPTRISFEKQEEDGWAQRFRETVKQKYKVYSLGLTQEQVQRLRNTPIDKKQMDYHKKNDEIVSTGEIVRFPDGEIFMAILTDGIEDIWGPEQAANIVSKFADDMAVFREHYPPGPPKHEDKRFKESYERDLARCTPLGYKVGVHHIGLRREDGNPQQIPCLTNETIAGRHKFQATNKFGQDVAIIKQTIGMILSVLFPESYDAAREIVETWSEKTPYRGITYTEREISTLTVMNTNLSAVPHTDPGDNKKVITPMHVWGDYDRRTGGEICVPITGKRYILKPTSIVLMRACDTLHFVNPPKTGQRFSMVHPVTEDMRNFNAVELPPTPGAKIAAQAVAKDPNEIKNCPFCAQEFTGLSGVKIHVSGKISKDGDEEHNLADMKKWLTEVKAKTAAKRPSKTKAKGKRTLVEHPEEEELKISTDKDDRKEERTMGETESSSELPAAKRQKIETGVKPVPVSSKYERYGQALFDENVEK